MMLSFKLRFSDIVFIATFAIVLALGPQMLSIDSDLGRHLTLGSYILDARIIPTRDLLSHTQSGLSRPPYEWLSQVFFALVYRIMGLDGVILLTSIVISATFVILYKYANQRSGSPIISLILIFIAVGASSLHWLPRPHIFTFLLLGIWIELLDRISRDRSVKIYIFFVVMVFWANLHGGFIYGILVWVAYFAGWLWDRWRKKADKSTGIELLTIGITSLIATVITPDLWHNWEAVLNNRSSYILNRTVETMRPSLTSPSVIPYTFLLALTLLLFTVQRKSFRASHFFLLSGMGILSMLMSRNIPLFVIACTPILAEMGQKSLSRFKIWTKINERFSGFGSTSGISVIPAAVTILAGSYFAYFNLTNYRSVYQFDPGVFPVQAVSFLEEHPQIGNMFNEFNWGGYLEYRLWPRYNVFLDSQSDFYGEALMRDYDQIMAAKNNWVNLLDTYQVEWAIIKPDVPLATALQNELDWEIIYQDNTAVILKRQ